MAERPDLQEFGSTGLRRSGGTVYEEFLVNLRGIRGAKIYREMADNDPTIGSMLFAVEKVITRLEWRVDPFSDDSSDGDVKPEDEETEEAGPQRSQETDVPAAPKTWAEDLKSMSTAELESALDEALREEDYYKAAGIRDEINRRKD